MIYVIFHIFQNIEEDGEDKENKAVVEKKHNKRSRLSLKRTAHRLTNQINKKIKNQRGEGDPVFTVSDPDENYFVLDIHNSKSFHKTEAAQEITYKAKLKHPAPDKNLSDLEPHLSALFESLIDKMKEKYGEYGVARIYIDHP